MLQYIVKESGPKILPYGHLTSSVLGGPKPAKLNSTLSACNPTWSMQTPIQPTLSSHCHCQSLHRPWCLHNPLETGSLCSPTMRRSWPVCLSMLSCPKALRNKCLRSISGASSSAYISQMRSPSFRGSSLFDVIQLFRVLHLHPRPGLPSLALRRVVHYSG